MGARILVAGSLNMDLRLSLQRLPAGGETCFGRDYAYIPGGKGANQAVAAARLGGSVTFCGRRGEDAHGAALAEGLRRDGVDISFLHADPGSSTGLAVIPVEEGGQNRIMVFSGANMRVSVQDLCGALVGDYDAVITQLEIPLETVFALRRLTEERGIPLILDAGPAMALELERLRGMEILSPNETETAALTGMEVTDDASALGAAKVLFERAQPRYVVLKLGGRGALLYGAQVRRFYPACPVKAVDTTAAGDAFTAALTVKYIETGDIDAAMAYANLVGGLTVTRAGAQPSLPTAAQVEAFRQSLDL